MVKRAQLYIYDMELTSFNLFHMIHCSVATQLLLTTDRAKFMIQAEKH